MAQWEKGKRWRSGEEFTVFEKCNEHKSKRKCSEHPNSFCYDTDWRNIGEIPFFPTKRERGMTGCDDEREDWERKEEEGFLISPLLLILLRRQQQDGIERKRGGEKAF